MDETMTKISDKFVVCSIQNYHFNPFTMVTFF